MFGKILLSGFVFLTAVAAANNQPPSQTFRVGEEFSYDVRWFIFPAGNASLSIKEATVINGQPCYHFVGRAQSQILFFFKVDDRIDSYSTADTLLPILFEKHLQEGKYKKDLAIVFDQKNHTAQYETQVYPVDPDCRDPLTAFYYFRTIKGLAPGKEVRICVHTDKNNYPLLIKVLKREKVKVPAGEFKTILIKLYPYPGFEGLFRHEGDIRIWLTDDEARIPVMIKVKVPIIGSVRLVLTDTKQP